LRLKQAQGATRSRLTSFEDANEETAMRKLVIAVLLVALLVAVGWLSFHYDGRQASVNFNADVARQDTRELAEKGREAVDRAAERGRELVDEAKSRDAAPTQDDASR
jgi:hypothetical protein